MRHLTFILALALVACSSKTEAPRLESRSLALVAPPVSVSTVYTLSRASGGHSRTTPTEGPDGRLYIVAWQNGPNDGGDAERSCSSNYAWDSESIQRQRCPGTVFSIERDGSDMRIEHAFTWIDELGRNADGYQPLGRLVASDDGWFYGTTRFGGMTPGTIRGCGTAYRFRSGQPSSFETLYSFCNQARFADGRSPQAGLIPDGAGGFIGVAAGGSTGSGVVFRLTGTTVSNIYTFSALDRSTTPATNAEGAVPYGSPTRGADGAWYGFSVFGGAQGEGAVFRVQPAIPDALQRTAALSSFALSPITTNEDNAPLQSLTLGEDGVLYGAHAFSGPAGTGQVFKVVSGEMIPLHTFSAISLDTRPYRFSNLDGAQPLSTLFYDCGWLYGTTKYGGAYGFGAIFRTSTDGTQHELLHSFLPGAFAVDGNYPVSGLMRARDGAFYGMTAAGGSTGFGVLYRMNVGGGHCP